MITTTRSSRKTGLLALSLLAHLVYVECAGVFSHTVDMEDLPRTQDELWNQAGQFTVLRVNNCHLDSSYMMSLGLTLPSNVQEVHLNLAAVPDYTPKKEQEGMMAKCNAVEKLKISYSPVPSEEGLKSPPVTTTLAWIRILFPNASKLRMDVEALPIQRTSFIDPSLLQELTVESVTELVLTGKGENNCPIQDNLELFPNAVKVDLNYIPTISALETWQRKLWAVPCVESLTLHDHMPVNKKIMGTLKSRFPCLRELSIGLDMFLKITGGRFSTDKEAPEGLDIRPLDMIEKLTIRDSPKNVLQEVFLGEKMAEIFPSVTEVNICSILMVKVEYSGIQRYMQMSKVRNARMPYATLSKNFDFWVWLFPSVSFSSSELKEFHQRHDPLFGNNRMRRSRAEASASQVPKYGCSSFSMDSGAAKQ